MRDVSLTVTRLALLVVPPSKQIALHFLGMDLEMYGFRHVRGAFPS